MEFNQIVLFDPEGKEVFNMRKIWLNFDRPTFTMETVTMETNMCLRKDTSYTIAVYNHWGSAADNQFNFSVAGEQEHISYLDFGLGVRGFTFASFVLRQSTAVILEEFSPVLAVYSVPSNGCNASEALLQVYADGNIFLQLFDMGGQQLESEDFILCVPRNGSYTLLTVFADSDATELEILVDETVIRAESGPFYNDVFNFPRIVSTSLTPELLAGPLSPYPSLSPSTITIVPSPPHMTSRLSIPPEPTLPSASVRMNNVVASLSSLVLSYMFVY